MDTIYIQASQHDPTHFFVDLETLVVLNIYRIAGSDAIHLKIKLGMIDHETIKVDLGRVGYEIVESWPECGDFCTWPVIIQGSYVVAGLCSVARQIIKKSQNKKIRNLLGFREACLMACSESSIWTRFCEVDMVACVKTAFVERNHGRTLAVPKDLLRFEYHMSLPVKIHNVYKVARQQNNDKTISSNVPVDQLNLHHTFSEGPFMNLSDVILFTLIKVLFMVYKSDILLRQHLPLTFTWFDTMSEKNVIKLKFNVSVSSPEILQIVTPEIPKQSLYTADPSRYKPERRIYTKQKDITNALRIIHNNHIDLANSLSPYGDEVHFDWSEIPEEANPMSGALPQSRAYRKCDQLSNLAKAVVKLAGMKQCRVVDFCSGSGHLGILIACLLPNCTVVLVENKEVSLSRAKDRIARLGLGNLIILQTNLDYFVASFDLGVSLHACGVATDLVIQCCIKNSAHFVCCPCCYGGIRDCYHLTYPRSVEYKNLKMAHEEYLTLAHAADQTHDPNNRKTTQGFVCMDAIDTDRKLYAENYGYDVHLGKLHPFSCTNKNNLLVGICVSR